MPPPGAISTRLSLSGSTTKPRAIPREDGVVERFTNATFSFDVSDTGPSSNAARASAAGSPSVVLLLHGLPQDRRSWDQVAAALAGDGYRVLAPDLRGYSP